MRRWIGVAVLLLALLYQAPELLAKGPELLEDLYLQALFLSNLTWPSYTPQGVNLEPEPPEVPPRDADVLKQPLAKNEQEIDAQQRVSAKRYAEAKRASGEQEAMPMVPDEIRASMPPLDRSGPEMRCGQLLPSESLVVTRDVEIYTRSEFQGAFGGSQYVWKYFVTFTNRGEETVQMLTRHWIFVDALGRLSAEVKGPGARGVTPVLPPKGEWTYESGTSLDTPYGSMHGSFQFDVLSPGGGSFSGRVGRLALSNDGKRKEVPCIDEDKEGLPLTSVLAVERVILGARAEFHEAKAGKYHFHYDVQFNNARDSDIEVLSHHWEVVDAKRKRHVVQGDGIGGIKQHRRSLSAGDAFRVSGEIRSPTKKGNAQGTYQVRLQTGEVIEARTDWMGLSALKDITHVPNFVSDPNFS